MKQPSHHGEGLRAACLVLALSLAAGVAWAQPPDSAGQGKHRSEKRGDDRDDDRRGDRQSRSGESRQGRVDIRIGGYFGDSQREAVREYYAEPARGCPPGLAKKHNGCMPPGQARKWDVGRPLPRDVIYHPVEPSIQVRLGVPPPGYKFVRVASDILLIAVGTGMVMDAIKDLGR